MTTDQDVRAEAAAQDPPPRRRRPLARATYLVGELLLTAGAVVLLFVAYQLFWTGVETAQAQGDLKDQLRTEWASPAPSASAEPSAAPGSTAAPTIPDVSMGEGIGIIRIPRFGPDYAWAVVEGVRLEDLARGPGHYPGTALPGEIGNFAVAAHRATHGEPFARVEELRIGDKVVVETATSWLTYSIYEIDFPVPVESTWALEPDPHHLGVAPTRAEMTLTTCHPRWGSTDRFLVFTELVETLPKSDGVLPAAITAGV